jgi:hypothetical protein
MKADRFIQIDSNEHHQQMTRLGKKIFPPATIHDRQITDIVITSPVARNAIMAAIETDFPQVSRIHFPALHVMNGTYHCSFAPVHLPAPQNSATADTISVPA